MVVNTNGALAPRAGVPSPAVRAEGRGETVGSPAVSAGTHLYLTGRPTRRQFIRYVRGHAVTVPDERVLTALWDTAAKVVDQLQKTEAGIADDAKTTPLGAEYEPLLIQLLNDPLVRYNFNTVPGDIALVELDKLVVYQKNIDISHSDQLARRLGEHPSPETIFRTCLPFDHPQPPAKWTRVKSGKYVFVSPSNDLRYLGPMPLERQHITGYALPGDVIGIVGIAVGFGSNFLNAIASEGRIILNNGSHRAYTLRKLGVTHVPCIIQHAATREELDAVAGSTVSDDADAFLTSPRPPMLRDYLDPRLMTVMATHRRLYKVTVKFEVEEDFVPAP